MKNQKITNEEVFDIVAEAIGLDDTSELLARKSKQPKSGAMWLG